jgi:hypothetical protein
VTKAEAEAAGLDVPKRKAPAKASTKSAAKPKAATTRKGKA